MTEQSAPQHESDAEQPAADEQPTVRLDDRRDDPDATRPMSLADLLNSD
ncbi:hypothetical protein [Dactylosporangium sp. NPDC005555]